MPLWSPCNFATALIEKSKVVDLAFQFHIGQPQTFEWQILVDVLNFGDNGCHQLGEAAVRDDFHRTLVLDIRYLFAQTSDKTLYKANMSINDAGLHIFDGVFAQSCTRGREVYAVQARGRATQCLRRNDQSRGDGTTEEVALG